MGKFASENGCKLNFVSQKLNEATSDISRENMNENQNLTNAEENNTRRFSHRKMRLVTHFRKTRPDDQKGYKYCFQSTSYNYKINSSLDCESTFDTSSDFHDWDFYLEKPLTENWRYMLMLKLETELVFQPSIGKNLSSAP